MPDQDAFKRGNRFFRDNGGWRAPTYDSKGRRIFNPDNMQDFAALLAKPDLYMQKTITIELKVRYKDKSRFDIVRKAAITAARGLLAAAQLISDEHKPMIAVSAFDPFDGEEGIDIIEADDNTEE